VAGSCFGITLGNPQENKKEKETLGSVGITISEVSVLKEDALNLHIIPPDNYPYIDDFEAGI
jgi:hypothetical protein